MRAQNKPIACGSTGKVPIEIRGTRPESIPLSIYHRGPFPPYTPYNIISPSPPQLRSIHTSSPQLCLSPRRSLSSPGCNAAAYAVAALPPGVPTPSLKQHDRPLPTTSPSRSPLVLDLTFVFDHRSTRFPKWQDLSAAPARRRAARRREAVAFPSSLLPRPEHRPGSMVGSPVCTVVYGRVAPRGQLWRGRGAFGSAVVCRTAF